MSPRAESRVCAVIVHHRGQELLAGCLRSLLASEGVDLEIVIVSNACREPMPDLVDTAEGVHVVSSERPIGFSTANNLGAAWASDRLDPCDQLLFINNDTIVEPTAIRRLVEVLPAGSQRAIAGPRLMIWGGAGILNSLGLNITRTGEAWDEGIGRPLSEFEPLEPLLDVTAVTGAALMIRVDVFEELDGWEDLYFLYFEDIDLCLRARSHGYDVVVSTDAVIHHAISATVSRTSDLKRQLSWRNRFLLMLIHWPAAALAGASMRTARAELRLAWLRLRARAWADLKLQVRSWLGAVRRFPQALRARSANGSERSWVEGLAPHGSVPVIVLPELPRGATLDADPGSAGS